MYWVIFTYYYRKHARALARVFAKESVHHTEAGKVAPRCVVQLSATKVHAREGPLLYGDHASFRVIKFQPILVNAGNGVKMYVSKKTLLIEKYSGQHINLPLTVKFI